MSTTHQNAHAGADQSGILPAAPDGRLHPACSALLESRHETFLQWCEPWPACGPEGNDLDAHIILRATVHDCINMQRRVAKSAGRPTMGDDENHLLDFIAVHWARVVEPNKALSKSPEI